MPNTAAIVSLRLPDATKARLDRAAKLTRRSRSFLMKEALEAYLPTILGAPAPAKSRLARLLAYEGAGAVGSGRTEDEIDAEVRDFRADD